MPRRRLPAASSKLRAAELMQKRCPFGPGPSSNTCPRWPPQAAAEDLGAAHEEAVVRSQLDGLRDRRLGEARPARSRVELRLGTEQRATACRAGVDALCLVVDVLAGERRLRSRTPQHVVLLGALARCATPPRSSGPAGLGGGRGSLPAHCCLPSSRLFVRECSVPFCPDSLRRCEASGSGRGGLPRAERSSARERRPVRARRR